MGGNGRTKKTPIIIPVKKKTGPKKKTANKKKAPVTKRKKT